MTLPIDTLLPLRVVEITLQFTEATQVRLFHQPALTAWLRHFIPDEAYYEHYLSLDAPESGCMHYQAGDVYRFSLTALAGGEAVLQQLLDCLRALPAGVKVKDKKAAFRDNLRWVAAHDLFTQQPIQTVADLTAMTFEQLEEEARAWQAMPEVRLRWLSPTRLLLPKAIREERVDEMRFCRHGRDLSFELLHARLHDTLANLLRYRLDFVPARQNDDTPRLLSADGFWVDFGYRNEYGNEKPMGGLLGTVSLAMDDVPLADWCQWVMGQYVNIGQRRVFGWGRYWLETPQGEITLLRTQATNSLLSAVGDELLSAYQHVSRQPLEVEAEEEDEAATEVETRLQRLHGKLLEGDYEIPPLRFKRLLDEGSGKIRSLAVPPFIDRVLQRAVAQVLTPALDSVMYHGSFGFRRGHSRQQAVQLIQRGYADGYRWVFESDVDDFFNAVRWQHLHTRLRGFFGSDPIVAWVMAWMQAPLQQLSRLETRSAGLPQGSPLSPVLANIMLDDFDSDLDLLGLRLVRFADDFVVLCESREQAEQVEQLVRASLAEVGLQVNEGKTRIRSFEQGFQFLGYVFMNSLVLDAGKETPPMVAAESAEPMVFHSHAEHGGERGEARFGMYYVGDAKEKESLVLVTGAAALVSSADGQLLVTRVATEEQTTMPTAELSLPWRWVQAVVLIGAQHHITTPALREAMTHGVTVHFADAAGQYQGSTLSVESKRAASDLWLAQLAWFGQPEQALQAACGLVKARVLHQRDILRRRTRKYRFAEPMEELKRLANKASISSDLAQLRGFEGAAARVYFQALQQVVPDEFGFAGRAQHPATDPFNALLSLGYTILAAQVETVIRARGLLPWIGLYHQPRGNHAVLVSDVMEPFRHVVELVVLEMVDKRKLTADDFVLTKTQGCRLTDEARRRYLLALSERFEKPFRGQQQPESVKLQVHVQYQVDCLINWLRGSGLAIWRSH